MTYPTAPPKPYRDAIVRVLAQAATQDAFKCLWELEYQGWEVPAAVKRLMREALPHAPRNP